MNQPLLLNDINLQLYYLEQNINQIIINNLNHATILILIIIFISGIFTSINPCNIGILAITTPYIKLIKEEFRGNLFFILGLISSFIIVTFFILSIGHSFQLIKRNIPIIYSIYMIILGLNFLNVIQLNVTFIDNISIDSWTLKNRTPNYIMGLIIGLSSSSCSTPIVATIMFWVSQSKSLFLGLLYLFFYSLGYGLPIIILTNKIISYTKIINVNGIWTHLVPISGSIILGFGTLSLFNNILSYI